MRNQNRYVRFWKLTGALALLVASLALLSPCFKVAAERLKGQQPQSPSQSQGTQAPSKRVQPDAVAIVNFGQLAAAEAKARKRGVIALEELKQNVVHAPMTIPDREDSVGAPQAASPSGGTAAAPSESGGPLIPSPSPVQNFQAINDAGTDIPPDTMGAVGPD